MKSSAPSEADLQQSGEPSEHYLSLVLEIESAFKCGREPRLDPSAVASLSPDELDRLKGVGRCLKLLQTLTLSSPCAQSAAAKEGALDRVQNAQIPQLGLKAECVSAGEQTVSVTRLGRFEIVRTLGAGAHGIVFLARDPVLQREIALKVPRPEGLLTDSLRSRFVRECKASAGLTHPNIVTVYEAGEIGAVCYLAQAYVAGPTLSDWLRERKNLVPVTTAAKIVVELCKGAQFAHEHGVLHRDLKPTNVLMEPKTPSELSVRGTAKGDPGADLSHTPKITDFGVAKLLDAESDETATNAIIGTVSFMAPEQASGKNALLSAATDVYGLGAILYELLTSEVVFRGSSTVETLRLVVEAEPLPPRARRPTVPRDLEAICLKCLEKNPIRRYATAAELAADLERYLAGEPTEAHPIRRSERLVRWCRRKPALAGLVGVSIVAVAALSVGGWYSSGRMKALLEDANAQRDLAEINGQLAQTRERVAQSRAYAADMRLLGESWDNVNGGAIRATLAQYVPRETAFDLRGFEWWFHYKRLNYDPPFVELGRHEGGVDAIVIDPGGKLAASSGADGIIRLWNVSSGAKVGELRGHKRGPINGVAFSPDGSRLASGANDKTVRIWDVAQRREVLCFTGHSGWVSSVLFLPDGHRVVSGAADKLIIVWDSATGREIHRLRGHSDTVRALVFLPKTGVLISSSEDKTVRVWDVEKGIPCTLVPNGIMENPSAKWIRRLAVDPEEKSMVGLPFNDAPVRWYVVHDQLGNVLPRPDVPGNARSIAYQKDSEHVVAYGMEESFVRVGYFASDRSKDRVLRGHSGSVEAVGLTQNLSTLVSGSDRGDVRLWRLDSPQRVVRNVDSKGFFHHATISPDGERIAAVADSGELTVFDFDRFEPVRQIRRPGTKGALFRFAPDSKTLATIAQGEPIRLFSGSQPPQEILLPDGLRAWSFAFSPNGRVMGIAGEYMLSVVDLQQRAVVRRLAHDAATRHVEFIDDASLLSTCRDGCLYRWSINDGRTISKLPLEAGEIRDLAVSPDHRFAAVRGFREVKIVDLTTMKSVASLPSPADKGNLSFLGRGRTLLIDESGSKPGLWQTGTWQSVGQIEMPDALGSSASSDGFRLVVNRGGGLATIDVRLDDEQETGPGPKEPARQ